MSHGDEAQPMTWLGPRPAGSQADAAGATEMPGNIYRYVLATSAWHQLALVLLTVAVFLLEIVPLELQRRVVNDLVKHRDFSLIIVLCAIYAGTVLAQGGILVSVLAYMVHVDFWMAATAFLLFVPQLVFVPLMQGAMNRRTRVRVQIIRQLSISIVEGVTAGDVRDRADGERIQQSSSSTWGFTA